MNLETLKKLRIVVPGGIIVLIIFYLSNGNFEILNLLTNIKISQLILTIILGSLYYVLDIRSWFWRASKEKVIFFIIESLLKPFKNHRSIGKNYDNLIRDTRICQVFYNFLDKDESLQKKVKNVYFNGLFWSSAADLVAISSLGAPLCFLIWIISKLPQYGIMVGILAIIFLLSKYVFLPKTTAKHLELAKEEIDYIIITYKNDLKKMIIGIQKSTK